MPAVVVGVVGMGHVPGIEKNWEKQLDINEIMRYVWLVSTYHGHLVTVDYVLITLTVSLLSVAPPSRVGWVLRMVIKGVMVGMLGYACYRAGGSLGRALLSLPAVQSVLETLRPPHDWPQWCFLRHQWHDLWFMKTMHLSPMALKPGAKAGGRGSPAPQYELTRTSRDKEALPRIDAPVDTVGLYCQRNHDSTPWFLYYFVQIIHFVRFTNVSNSFWIDLHFPTIPSNNLDSIHTDIFTDILMFHVPVREYNTSIQLDELWV